MLRHSATRSLFERRDVITADPGVSAQARQPQYHLGRGGLLRTLRSGLAAPRPCIDFGRGQEPSRSLFGGGAEAPEHVSDGIT